ncbi:MAG: serine hydroxymethyltransferase [Candidatus Bathyarchaeota archaeon]
MEEVSNRALELIKASKNHEEYRGRECINLIASEGLKSPAVHEMLNICRDLESRYTEGENDFTGHVKTRHYQGQKYITAIEDFTVDLMKTVLGSDWADIRSVSGTQANLVAFKGLTVASGNRKLAVTPLSCGAHISHDYTGLAGMIIGLETINLSFNVDEMNIDPDKSAEIIRAAAPGIVIFGSSLFLFPHPVRELVDAAREVGAYVVYDAAHVLGLIVGKQFQNPLEEGADFVTASTHKTFPGPQGGLVYARLDDERRIRATKKILNAIFPLATSNTHPGRFPALGLTAVEMKLFGEELAKEIVANAQTAGQYLSEAGLKVLGEDKGFTRSHQIAVDVAEFGGGAKIAKRMEDANIILNKNLLPYDNKKDKENPSGLRIGFQDVTRRGFKKDDVRVLCNLIGKITKEEIEPEKAKVEVMELARKFNRIEYGFNSVKEAMEKLEKM